VPAAVGAALIMNRRRVRPLIAAMIMLVAGVLPVLGFSTFDFEMMSTVSDHYLYLAMIGPALAAAWALTRCAKTERWPILAAGGALALLAACSANQERYWQDTRALFTHAIELNPQSWSSWYGLGYLNHMEGRRLAAQATADQTQGLESAVEAREAANDLLESAMDCYRETVHLNPSHVGTHHGYGAMLMYFGAYKPAGQQFVEVLKRRDLMTPAARPQYYADTDLLGQCLLACGRTEQAVHAFEEALKLQPPPAEAAAHLQSARAALAARQLGPATPVLTDTRDEASKPAAAGD
jgi:tetratricopeptide (TPR) repeat protein